MERRRSRRIAVTLNEKGVSGDEKHIIFIEDISESGIHIIAAHSVVCRKYTAGVDLDMSFRISPKRKITQHCKTRWVYHKMPPEKEIDSVGLEIIHTPDEDIEFIRAFSLSGN